MQIIFKSAVLTSKKISARHRYKYLDDFQEKAFAPFSENHMKPIKTLCERLAEFLK
jgi:hypothetical protein